MSYANMLGIGIIVLLILIVILAHLLKKRDIKEKMKEEKPTIRQEVICPYCNVKIREYQYKEGQESDVVQVVIDEYDVMAIACKHCKIIIGVSYPN